MRTVQELRDKATAIRTRLAGGTSPQPPAATALSAPGMREIINELWYGGIWARPELDAPYRCLATVSVLTALGRLQQLRGHTANALRVGISPAQVLALMVHIQFYAGAPAALSAIEVAHEVFKQRPEWVEGALQAQRSLPEATMDERRRRAAAMREHLWGKQPPGSVPAASQLAPDFLDLAYAYLFGEVYYDATLSLQQRSVCTVAVLTALGREPQLRVHIRAALNVGLTKQQVVEVITHVAAYAGLPATLNALGVAKAVFDGG